MTFNVAAAAYDRYMGRYSSQLSTQMADLAGVRPGQRVLDVGCGPGVLTTELASRLGPENVAAVDPSEPFVEAARTRIPGAQVLRASAESLPFDDDTFDAALAQLVVHFMSDPLLGLTEMRRVTRRGGVVAACVWDHADRGPLATFWEAVRELDPTAHDESDLAGVREGHLAELFGRAGLRQIAATTIVATVEHSSFEEWWEPYTLGVGPAGAYLASLDAEQQTRLRELCRTRLPQTPFVVTARAWAVRAFA